MRSVSRVLWCSERVLGENLHVVSEKDVCILDLAKYKLKSCDMNIIMWLFSHLASTEVYHIDIFICIACLQWK